MLNYLEKAKVSIILGTLDINNIENYKMRCFEANQLITNHYYLKRKRMLNINK